ncbi:hypothetical protein ACQU0X_30825 [Pseudovibrio ascidiaceicola]|uniref:hypothetical protein n=1 Tax=Pseudovibrio ascidiaceicola TaxID=285279 RepID=UPI003D36F3A2
MPTKPILFSAPMVTALLEGRKTMTRRILTPQPSLNAEVYWAKLQSCWRWQTPMKEYPGHCFRQDNEPINLKHAPGVLLWVRESWRTWAQYDDIAPSKISPGTHIAYEATDNPNLGDNAGKGRPSIFMLRWASRLTLEVTDVRVEQLQKISTQDAISEGIEQTLRPSWHYDRRWKDYSGKADFLHHPIESFHSLWDSLNKDRGFGWDANPWVSVTEFKVHKCNVDEFSKGAT